MILARTCTPLEGPQQRKGTMTGDTPGGRAPGTGATPAEPKSGSQPRARRAEAGLKGGSDFADVGHSANELVPAEPTIAIDPNAAAEQPNKSVAVRAGTERLPECSAGRAMEQVHNFRRRERRTQTDR